MQTARTSQMLGALLRRYGLTRSAVADALFVSEDTVDNWCIGRSGVRPHMLTSLANFLRERGIPAEEVAEYVRAEATAGGLDLKSMAEYASRPSTTWQKTILVLISDPRFVSQSTLMSGISDEVASSSSFEVAVLSDWSSRHQHVQQLKAIRLHRPAALVILSQSVEGGEAGELRANLVADGIRVISCQPTHIKGETMVRVDERHLMELAVSHLHSLGHRHIGALFVRNHPVQEERFTGFQQAIAKYRLNPDDLLVRWATSEGEHRAGQQPLEQTPVARAATHLAQREDVTAIIAPSEIAAVSILLSLRREGRRCPGDVSVLAIRPCAWTDSLLNPPLTHINLPYYETGRLAGRLALGLERSSASTEVTRLDDHVICARTGGTVGRARPA